MRRLLPLVAAFATAAGCQMVGTTTLTDRDGPLASARTDTRLRPRAMQVDVTFVRCGIDDRQRHDSIWQHVDEQAIDEGSRRRLNANGIRVGVVSGDLPAEFASWLTSSSDAEAEVVGVDATRTRQHLQLLPGRRGEVVTASHLDSLMLFEQLGDRVSGTTFHDASPMLAIEARPAADGDVRLDIVPEVKHGPVEKNWIGEDGQFRLDAGQRSHRLDHLTIAATLPPGGMLILGSGGGPSATIGDSLLRDHDGDTLRLIVVRPLGRSIDPVFTPVPDDQADEAE